jgi:hypothetical protein
MDEPVCPNDRDAPKWIASSSVRVAELTRTLEEAIHSGKHPRAPLVVALVGTDAAERCHTEIPRRPRVREFVVHQRPVYRLWRARLRFVSATLRKLT